MENEKILNKKPAAPQGLPDESLDAVAGGANYGNVRYRFTSGDKVKFAMTDGGSPSMQGVVRTRCMKEYNGQTIPHYAITVNYYTGSTIFHDVPEHRIFFAI